MIIEAKADYKTQSLFLIHDSGAVDTLPLKDSYFYVIHPKRIPAKKVGKLALLMGATDYEGTDYVPIVFNGTRYVFDKRFSATKIFCGSPRDVPNIAREFMSKGFRCSMFNMKHIVRNVYDYGVRFFNIKPFFEGFDDRMAEKISKVKLTTFDIEVRDGKPFVVSVLTTRIDEEPRHDDVQVYQLPSQRDEFVKHMSQSTILLGHNIVGFDLPVLEQNSIHIDTYTKLILDNVEILQTYGNSFQIGASKDLFSVARVLKNEAGITDEELELKHRVSGHVEDMPIEDVIKYNINDVVLTAKIGRILASFIIATSGIFQIPPHTVIETRSGIIAEYTVARDCELKGYVPEYRTVNTRISGERVYCPAEKVEYTDIVHVDVKAMYPSTVLQHDIDPVNHVGDEQFKRLENYCPVYDNVKKLYQYRMYTKKLKKEDPMWKPVDSALKSILNAMAYGFQAKRTGYTCLGNPFCPRKIFYTTLKAQYDTIRKLENLGYKVIYSDTDSFMILRNGKPVEEIVDITNKIIGKYGLVVDLEEVWDYMYIYTKKNYIQIKGDKIVIKGGALKTLERGFLPDCISLEELVREKDVKKRIEYVVDRVTNSPMEDLFITATQIVWRLIGKGIEDLKRQEGGFQKYIRANTPWDIQKFIYLKRMNPGQARLYHLIPLVELAVEKGGRISLAEMNPLMVVEAKFLRSEFPICNLANNYLPADILLWRDGIYAVKVKKIKYELQVGNRPIVIDANYSDRYLRLKYPRIVSVIVDYDIKRIHVSEDLFRELVVKYVIRKLREYRLV